MTLDSAIVQAARSDPAVFCAVVLRDEQTGRPITLAPVHEQWHDLVERHRRLVIQSAIELGKTAQISVGRVLFELGRNPNARVTIVCNTSGQAAKVANLIAHYIKSSTELHAVFPHLVPAEPWNQTALTVARSAPSKDPSVQVCGIHGSILGARTDLLILDDPHDMENSRTPSARDDVDSWVTSTLLGRLTDQSRAVCVANVWHTDDLLARLARKGWHSVKFPVQDEHGASVWPERWSDERIRLTRTELGPREAPRQLDCVPPQEASAVFDAAWIADAIRAGADAPTEFFASASEPGDVIVLGVDPAYSEKRSADESALVLVRASRASGKREITMVDAGRWTFDELCSRVVHHCKMRRAVAAIELNAGGEFVSQQIGKQIPSVGLHTTGQSKRMRVELLLSELSQGRWSFRAPMGLDDGMRRLAQELGSFSYEDHCGDRLAALLIAVEAIRIRERRPVVRQFRLDTVTR